MSLTGDPSSLPRGAAKAPQQIAAARLGDRSPSRLQSPRLDPVQQDILEVAARHFAERGYAGARIDEIAASTRTSKRMIYHHFGGKEPLYRRVLARALGRARCAVDALDLASLSPVEGLKAFVAFAFDLYQDDLELVGLIAGANIERVQHTETLPEASALRDRTLEVLNGVLRRGVASGAFRPGLAALDLYMSIDALCFFAVANRHTFSLLHAADMSSATAIAARRRQIVETILRMALRQPAAEPGQPSEHGDRP